MSYLPINDHDTFPYENVYWNSLLSELYELENKVTNVTNFLISFEAVENSGGERRDLLAKLSKPNANISLVFQDGYTKWAGPALGVAPGRTVTYVKLKLFEAAGYYKFSPRS